MAGSLASVWLGVHLSRAIPAGDNAVTQPFHSASPVKLSSCLMQGKEIEGPGEGFFCIKAPWPSTLRTVYGDHARFETTYFEPFKVAFTASASAATGLSVLVEHAELACLLRTEVSA